MEAKSYEPIIEAKSYEPMKVIVESKTYDPIIKAETYKPMEAIIKAKSYEPLLLGKAGQNGGYGGESPSGPTIQPVRGMEKPKFTMPVAAFEDKEEEEEEDIAIIENSQNKNDDNAMLYAFGGVAVLTFALFLGNRRRY